MMRLILDGPFDGVTNMARDEAMLMEVGRGNAPPTLRLYQWSTPTISLGYFQKYADYEALPPSIGGLPVVRRLTGGGAILHDLEVTYSLAIPTGHDLLKEGANRLYELAHDAIIASFHDLNLTAARCGESDDSGAARGPFFCFERRHCYDVLLGKQKIAGSAQRRTRHAVLQHGSVVLPHRQPPPTGINIDELRPAGDRARRLSALASLLAEKMQIVFQSEFEACDMTSSESELASTLVEKYTSINWLQRT